MLKPRTIAIDGPAGAGKSTIAELLAERLGYLFLDTGAMYRAITWLALQDSIASTDCQRLSDLARKVKITILGPTVLDGRKYTVLIDGQDVTWDLRRPEVDQNVSAISACQEVREALVPQQRESARQERVVMVGRDIGTVVLPEADLKIYLDASLEERARRRYAELAARGKHRRFNSVLAEMRRRDQIDSERQASPLRVAEDARVVDTDGLTIQQVLGRVMDLLNANDGHKGED
ncbi:MAG: (d)CMP kinase [Chloroflexi bacterium]|nr:(d)CMP kinase [Chloroflexota bacterium]